MVSIGEENILVGKHDIIGGSGLPNLNGVIGGDVGSGKESGFGPHSVVELVEDEHINPMSDCWREPRSCSSGRIATNSIGEVVSFAPLEHRERLATTSTTNMDENNALTLLLLLLLTTTLVVNRLEALHLVRVMGVDKGIVKSAILTPSVLTSHNSIGNLVKLLHLALLWHITKFDKHTRIQLQCSGS